MRLSSDLSLLFVSAAFVEELGIGRRGDGCRRQADRGAKAKRSFRGLGLCESVRPAAAWDFCVVQKITGFSGP
jgi:hypothetical protein